MRHFHKSIIAISLVGLVACEPVPVGGAGQSVRGEPLAGEIVIDPMGENNQLFIRSAAGWQCSSTFKSNPGTAPRSLNRTVPLTCSNGAKGNALMSLNQQKQRMTVAFKLTNGEAGEVSFGNV